MHKDEKLIQIMTAPTGLKARVYDDDGDRRETYVFALGLTDQGNVYYLIVDPGNGEIRTIRSVIG